MSDDPRESRNKYLSSRDRDRDRRRDPPICGPSDYHSRPPLPRKRCRSRSPSTYPTTELEKRRSRSPRINDKDLDEKLLNEIAKLPEPSELWDIQNQFSDGLGGSPAPVGFSPEGMQPNPVNANYQPPYPGMYDDFPLTASVPQTSRPPDMASWHQMSLPPAPPAYVEDQIKKASSLFNHKFNYVYYDPEMHWCRVCNEFPPTAKDYLNHLHSPAHHKMAAAHVEAPWHNVPGVNEGFPSLPSAPTKRTPIKGLQFFVPSIAWYCKLCDQFIGDMHCASAHLMSIIHSKNYQDFVEQNPDWETDWVSDRQKAFEKSRANKNTEEKEKPQQYTSEEKEKPQQNTSHTTFSEEDFLTKNKDSPPPEDKKKKKKKKKEKKKKAKRRASNSSSSSDFSISDSDSDRKKVKAKKLKSKALSYFMSAVQLDILTDNDRDVLYNIKNRMKMEKEIEEENRRSSERFTRLAWYCPQCDRMGHGLLQCRNWRRLPVVERRRMAKRLELCFCCLGSHFARDCQGATLCKACGGRHHKLLCNQRPSRAGSTALRQEPPAGGDAPARSPPPSDGGGGVVPAKPPDKPDATTPKAEEMDDLAMLGIDTADVGAGTCSAE